MILDKEMGIDEDMLRKQFPTAQVRILCNHRLSDGKIHTRKDLIEYAKEQGKKLGLDTFREGHLTGGVRQCLMNDKCEKIGPATYRLIINEEHDEKSISSHAAEICENFINQMTSLSREIDYICADEKEMNLLDKMRKCVLDLKKYKDSFNEF